MKDYCVSVTEIRPFYWIEESADLYSRAGNLISRLKQMARILDSAELESLIEIDMDLIGLWQSFEKDAMLAAEKIRSNNLIAIRVPIMFGYPSTMYYYHGIIISKTSKEDVVISNYN